MAVNYSYTMSSTHLIQNALKIIKQLLGGVCFLSSQLDSFDFRGKRDITNQLIKLSLKITSCFIKHKSLSSAGGQRSHTASLRLVGFPAPQTTIQQ